MIKLLLKLPLRKIVEISRIIILALYQKVVFISKNCSLCPEHIGHLTLGKQRTLTTTQELTPVRHCLITQPDATLNPQDTLGATPNIQEAPNTTPNLQEAL